ncbi:NAD-dependent epimerase/dehydratase family protein [Oerskovia sp. KBS0722]|uniref:NAD-dependent epimerase/dehydratase family protein n=1 Tax=Oerskovia sp. KBS0722 TaxID=1179673 RepID=UPI00110F1658|nr:NAD-dependent epimerase/dehydratase family protein [Oerskovia sp. KBS0722]QDW61223.1 NAD-dependent epimerase/dehydratase family protein [Oerskovia sp. KBS0722]
MRVVVVGASGNVGSALLRRLAGDPVVTSVVGVASRVPRADGSSTVVPPFDTAEWARCDLTDPEEVVASRLAGAFVGADAVVHLAWAIDPAHDREELARVNVEGTRRVAAAAARAGVGHLVVASCASACSPAFDDTPRDEYWPTAGIAGSVSSAQKAEVEEILDRFSAEHPGVVVTRVRAPFTFQRDAASEVSRLFFGKLLPAPLRRKGHLPTLVWPRGMRLQVVHADDLADAYLEILVGRHAGTFNVAAPDVLTGPDVAAIVSQGRLREVSPGALRRAVALAWAARLVPLDPGWFDVALAVPVLDTSRARRLLRWAPVHDARATVTEVVGGLVEGAGTQSPPLLPS